ncbi:MAG: hypothetical protein MUF53_13000 [Gemmatimonadaceae bacterium]|nr:hypothetical protein [Gemmatimonadaceae bacterium]
MTPGAVAKGATVRATFDWLASAVPAETVQALRVAADPSWTALDPTAEVPYADLLRLWREVDRRVAAAIPDWAERAGAHSIASVGQQLYGGILRKRSPTEFLTQSVSLFRLFYQPGNMEVVTDEPGHAVLRLVGFDPADRLFCRRLTGGLGASLSVAGGDAPRVRHVRCTQDGDAFCEWGLQWR